MNYIGSKQKLSSFLKEAITQKVGRLDDKVFCDLFAGTGIVGRVFKKDVKKVISNDLEYYSYVLNKNYIENHKKLDFKNFNELPLQEGFIYQNYSLSSGRCYFSDENAKKIDTIRQEIEKYNSHESLYYFLLASLLESSDKVANTASIYGAYLKKLKKTAQKELVFTPAEFDVTPNSHESYNEDANELIKKIKGDILYLDPPYNQRQYGANYHLLNTIALYDRFIPSGKTGLRAYVRSSYCKKKEASKSFDELLRDADFRYIFVSYNNEGLMCKDEIKSIMSKYGEYDLVTKEYQRFKADTNENRHHKAKSTIEYLHILEKK